MMIHVHCNFFLIDQPSMVFDVTANGLCLVLASSIHELMTFVVLGLCFRRISTDCLILTGMMVGFRNFVVTHP
jgi:hypothetical protein